MPQQISGPSGSSSLLDVIDTILDKGLVIDIYVRVSVVGIEILTIEARIVVASVDTYLRYATAVMELGREFDREIPLAGVQDKQTLTEFVGDTVGAVTEGGARGKSKGAVGGAIESVKDALSSDDEEEEQPVRRRRK